MTLNQSKPSEVSGQFEYLGRWVDKKHFRAFVYNESGEKLAGSYEEYEKLISSGLWFSTKKESEIEEMVQKVEENLSNVTNFSKKPSKPKLR